MSHSRTDGSEEMAVGGDYTLNIRRVSICKSAHLTDHHKRTGEVLLGVAIDGATTLHTVLLSLPDAWADATLPVAEPDEPAIDRLFNLTQQKMLADAEASGQAHRRVAPHVAIDDESDPAFNAYAEPVQAWYLVTISPVVAGAGA